MFRPLAAGAVALALLAAPAPADAGVVQYFKDRGTDFLDIFRVRVGMPNNGNGYGAKVRATALLQAGFVHFDGDYIGLDRRGIGWMEERRTEGGISLAYASRHETIPRWGNQYLMAETLWSEIRDRRIVRNDHYWDDGRGDLLGFSVEVATPIGAIDLGVNPSQAVDFVVGFLLIDPFKDDELGIKDYWRYNIASPTDPPEPNLQAATARKRAQMEADRARAEQLTLRMEEIRAQMQAEIEEAEREAELEAVLGPAGLGQNEALTGTGIERVLEEGEEVDWDPEAAPARRSR